MADKTSQTGGASGGAPKPDERASRHRPGTDKAKAPPAPLGPLRVRPRVHLVAPSFRIEKHNTLRLVSRVEVRLLSPHGKPIPDERCQLFAADGKILEARTDKEGVVRFEGLPMLPPPGATLVDVGRPGLVFPDILEECVAAPPGNFGKNQGLRDDYRQDDGMVHFVDTDERVDVVVNALTSEQKLRHFIATYLKGNAHYDHPKKPAGRYSKDDRRWQWNNGAVCNQHVNFFLGYWFNYDDKFTPRGSATAISVLPLFSSKLETFGGVCHRGYLEFLEPVNGFGFVPKPSPKKRPPDKKDEPYDPDDSTTLPNPSAYSNGIAYTYFEQIRMARYFDAAGNPTDKGKELIDSLADLNIYALSDIKSTKGKDRKKQGEDRIRAWRKKHRRERGMGRTDAQIDKLSEKALWDIAFDLEDEDAIDRELVKSLTDLVFWDHHAGVLLVRDGRAKAMDLPAGVNLPGPVTAATKLKELWTFSADGGTAGPGGQKIRPKRFSQNDLSRPFVHLGIFRLKPLASGGFARDEARDNEGQVDVDAPPRFIKWG